MPTSSGLTPNQELGMVPLITSWATGNGVTDDTAEINIGLAAIAAATPGNAYVVFPAGNYLISGQGITVPSNITIVGHGSASRIFNAGMSAGYGMVNFSGSNSGLKNILLDGQVTNSTSILYSALPTHGGSPDPYSSTLTTNSSVWVHPGASDITFSGVILMHTGGYGFLIDASSANINRVTFTDCNFHDNRPHLFGASGIYGGSWTGGIYLHCDGSSSLFSVQTLTVTNCRWRRCTGHGLWSHSYGFGIQHTNWTITNCSFEDMGLDCILVENVFGVSITNVTGHRIGYVTGSGGSDTDSPVPVWVPPNYNAVGLDHGGYVRAFVYSGVAFYSVNGEGFDLDGAAHGTITNPMVYVPQSGEVAYTTDSVASYGYSGSGNITAGINTNNSNLNGGSQYINITGGQISNCGSTAITLAYGKFCVIKGVSIFHPSTATEVPIQLIASNSSGSDETLCHDNTVEDNTINYSGGNYCVIETGTGWVSTNINHVQGNWILGSNYGEFLRVSTSGSSTIAGRSSSNNSGLTSSTSPTLAGWQTEGAGSGGVYKLYANWSVSGTPTGGQIIQVNFNGPVVNSSLNGGAGTGAFATGNVTAVGILDSVNTARYFGSGYIALTDGTGDTSLNGVDGISSNPAAHWALRWNHSLGVVQQSYSTDGSGNRIWSAFSAGTSSGASGCVQYSNGSGGFSSFSGFTYVTGQLNIQASEPGGNVGTSFQNTSSAAGTFTSCFYYNDAGSALEVGSQSSGSSTFPQTSYVYSNSNLAMVSAGVIAFASGGLTEHARFDSSGDLLLGATSIPSTSTGAQLYGTGFASFDSGLLTVSTSTNAIHAPNGTVTALYGTFTGTTNPVVQCSGSGASMQAPLLVATDSVIWVGESAPAMSAIGQARLYFDSSSHTLQVSLNGGAYGNISSPTPAGSNTYVQFNNSGALGASGNFTWSNGSQLLTVAGIAATAGINVTGGYIQSTQGFLTNFSGANAVHAPNGTVNSSDLACTDTANNTIQAVNGGMTASTGYWVGSIQIVNSSGVIVTSAGISTSAGITAAGFNPTGNTGQSYDIGPLPTFQVNGAGSFTHIHTIGGVITSVS